MTVRRPLRVVAWPYAIATVVLLALWLAQVDHPATQVLDLATFWWSLAAVVLVVVAAVLRDGRAALLFAIPAAVWVWSYAGAFLPGSPADGPADLRVVSFNTFVHAPDASHVVEVAETTGADVLLLQEVFPDREAELRELLVDTYPYLHFDQSEGVGAVAVVSRFPIVDAVAVGGTSDRTRSTSIVTLDVGGVAVQTTSLHLISPCPSCGPSILERLELESQTRRAEVGAVLDALDPELPAIVGGDLNSNDRSSAYRRLVAAGFGDAQRAAGSGMGFTWPADGRLVPPFVRIDWVLSRGATAVDAWVGDGGPSDHLPVVVDVALDDR